jgi:hypothetical protein
MQEMNPMFHFLTLMEAEVAVCVSKSAIKNGCSFDFFSKIDFGQMMGIWCRETISNSVIKILTARHAAVLTSMSLTGCSKLSQYCLVDFLQCQRLEYLNLNTRQDALIFPIKAVYECCKQLRRLKQVEFAKPGVRVVHSGRKEYR